MEIVPTTLVRISRYYMVAAIGYLLLTLAIGMYRALAPIPSDLVHWAPAILGWITFPIMGAYYQFFPTLQGRDLKWDSLTIPQFVLVNVGVLGLMAASWAGNAVALQISAGIYTVGALLFAAIIGLANLDLSKVNLTLRFYLAALVYFIAAIALFFLSIVDAGPAWATRPLILHVLVFGWAIITIMGAEYSMVPMLQLKTLRHPRLADAQFYLINAGFIGLALALVAGTPLLIGGAGLALLAGILTFVYIIAASLISGPSRMPHMDVSVKYFVVALAYLVVTAIGGILMGAFGWYSLLPIHVHLGVIGTITITIIGAMYHVVPFVVWWEVYAPKLGYEDVPLLKQLYNERSANYQLYGLNAGLLLMVVGFALQTNLLLAAGGLILLITSLAFAWAMISVIGHRRKLNNSSGHQSIEKISEVIL